MSLPGKTSSEIYGGGERKGHGSRSSYGSIYRSTRCCARSLSFRNDAGSCEESRSMFITGMRNGYANAGDLGTKVRSELLCLTRTTRFSGSIASRYAAHLGDKYSGPVPLCSQLAWTLNRASLTFLLRPVRLNIKYLPDTNGSSLSLIVSRIV